ncbi:MAG TPA: glycosyltransferase family 1 protein [Coleofasciculaceae cyanobacterium]|jgi:glycosyltransferase involved in cell wall biosynthesis
MHILIAVLHRPTKPTGVCRHAANLALCLANLPEVIQVTLVTGAWQRHYFETTFALSSPKIKIIDVDIQNRSSTRNLWYLFGLPKLANQLCPDIVHLSFPLPFFRSRFSCPVVATIHDLYPYEYPENFGRVQAIFNRLFLRQCITQSDGLTCVSQETLKLLKFFFPRSFSDKEVSVTYNLVDFSNVRPECPEVFKNRENSSFLLSVAQHRKNKNLDILIQTFAELLRSGKLNQDIELILVGSPGPETNNLQQQVEDLQLKSQVRFLSSISDPQLSWLYQHALLYVVASSTEGFCLPLAEALHLGCHAVCSDIPILREISADNCTYFNLQKDAANNLGQAIITAIHQPNNNQANKDLRFSKTTIASQYFKLYSNIINK